LQQQIPRSFSQASAAEVGEMGEGGESGEMGQEEGKGWKSHLAWLLNTFMYITFCRLLFCDSLLMIYRNHQEDAPSFDFA